MWISPALAQEAAGHAADAAEHGGGGGLPQLDATTYPAQIFWLVVAFVVLYRLLRSRALPRVTEVLEARDSRRRNDLDRAAELRQEAEAALEKHNALVADARARGQSELQEMRERLQRETAERQAEHEKKLQAQIDEAEERVAKARAEALEALDEVAVDLAQEAYSRLIGKKVTRKSAETALHEVHEEAA